MNAIFLMGLAMMLVGICNTWYWLWQLLALARRRGMPHPCLRGFVLSGSQHGEGLLLYLAMRRKYRLLDSGEDTKREAENMRRHAMAGILLMAAGAAMFVTAIVIMTEGS